VQVGLLARIFGFGKKAPAQAAPKQAAPRRAAPAFSLLALSLEPERRPELTPEVAERADEIAAQVLSRFETSKSDVPALPSVATEVMELVNDPESDINALVKLINQDPNLAAQLLRVANSSAVSGGGPEVDSTRDACVRLGSSEVGQIVAATAMRSAFAMEAGGNSCLPDVGVELWRRSLGVAHGAGWLAMRINVNTESLFLCGMLHNIGQAIGLRFLSEILEGAELQDECLVHAVLARVHDDIGGAAAQMWELPRKIGACCSFHRAPANSNDAPLVHTIRAAAGLNELRVNPWYAEGTDRHVQASADALGLDLFTMRALHTELREAADRIVAIFG